MRWMVLVSVIVQELVCRPESCTLVAINKRMVARDALSMASGELGYVSLAVGALVPWTVWRGFEQGPVVRSQ